MCVINLFASNKFKDCVNKIEPRILLILSFVILHAFFSQAQQWQTSNGNLHFAAGSVGIGTTTPNSPMEIKSENSNNDVILARFVHRASTTEAGAGIQLGGKNDDKGFGAKILGYSNPYATYNSRMSFFTSSGLNSWNLGLTQDKDGNIGIGTTTPNSRLEATSENSNSDVILARFIHRANTTEAGAGIQLGGINDDRGFGAKILGYSNPNATFNSRLSIYTSSGLNTWNLGLTQDKDGNVGIGTTAPTQKLSVNGKINAEEIILEDVSGADFVFEEDYDLRSLEETEQFIKANKHLPEVPSAAEMAEEGLELKEMNILLLQKVEELTLHLIRMEKEAEEMRQRLNVLEEK